VLSFVIDLVFVFSQGRRVADSECVNDVISENEMLKVENVSLRQRNKALQETVESLTARNVQLVIEKEQIALNTAIGSGMKHCADYF